MSMSLSFELAQLCATVHDAILYVICRTPFVPLLLLSRRARMKPFYPVQIVGIRIREPQALGSV